MISVRGLTKRYGDVRAVDDLTFDAVAALLAGGWRLLRTDANR